MIEQIYNYFTIETLYYWVNFGVLPFWLILIFFSDTKVCRIFVTSIFPFLLLSSAYIFILYKSYLSSYDFVSNFNLYTSKDGLKNLFSNDFFIMMFWIHFISINLFTGGWIVKDSQKLAINKILIILPLVITYLIGPIGLLIYWLIRIFYAKNINMYD